jgi:hypothetical protein
LHFPSAPATGYWLAAADGGISSFGTAPFLGSMAGHRLDSPVVGMASIPGVRAGYYEVAADGGIFGFGSVNFFGSMGGQHLKAPIVGMALGPDVTGGYYEVASDGGVFVFGDAPFLGSMAGHHLDAPIVGLTLAQTSPPPAIGWFPLTEGCLPSAVPRSSDQRSRQPRVGHGGHGQWTWLRAGERNERKRQLLRRCGGAVYRAE